MSEYKQIHGQTIRAVSSNPSNTFSGEVWYNKTTKKLTFKGYVNSSSWATGGALGVVQSDRDGAGTQTAALACAAGTATEEYDGSSWTSGGSTSTTRGGGGAAGTQTAGLAIGSGPNPANAVEEYNGSSWTSGGNLSTGRQGVASDGAQTAAIAFGGSNYPNFNNETENYDGSSWTSGGNLNTSRFRGGGCGTQTSALFVAGQNAFSPMWANTRAVEEYNGTSWSAGADYGTAPSVMGQYGGVYVRAAGDASDAVAFGGTWFAPWSGGEQVQPGETFTYDGTSWSAGAAQPIGQSHHGGNGTTSAALSFGNNPSPVQTTTLEYSGPGPAIVTADTD